MINILQSKALILFLLTEKMIFKLILAKYDL